MPEAGKSAAASNPYDGDLKAHLFRINTSAEFRTVPPGSTLAKDAIDVGFACLQCHTDMDRAWASEMAVGMHQDADLDTFADADERAKGSDPQNPLSFPLT